MRYRCGPKCERLLCTAHYVFSFGGLVGGRTSRRENPVGCLPVFTGRSASSWVIRIQNFNRFPGICIRSLQPVPGPLFLPGYPKTPPPFDNTRTGPDMIAPGFQLHRLQGHQGFVFLIAGSARVCGFTTTNCRTTRVSDITAQRRNQDPAELARTLNSWMSHQHP